MPPAAALRPGEERQDAARRPLGVAKIEVIGAGIVEVDGQLHESEAEDLRVEVEIALRVAGDRRDVMKTEDLAHNESSRLTCVLATPLDRGREISWRRSAPSARARRSAPCGSSTLSACRSASWRRASRRNPSS